MGEYRRVCAYQSTLVLFTQGSSHCKQHIGSRDWQWKEKPNGLNGISAQYWG